MASSGVARWLRGKRVRHVAQRTLYAEGKRRRQSPRDRFRRVAAVSSSSWAIAIIGEGE